MATLPQGRMISESFIAKGCSQGASNRPEVLQEQLCRSKVWAAWLKLTMQEKNTTGTTWKAGILHKGDGPRTPQK